MVVASDKNRKHLFKIQLQSPEISQIFVIFRLPPFHLKQERNVAKPCAIFQSFLLEMLGFIHSSMTGNFNPNLSRGSEPIAI